MTDSILRSYYNVTSSSFVPFTSAGDTTLLAGETDGLAIDFTDTTYFDTQVWDQDWNQVRTASVDSLTSPHTFYTNSGTSAKVVKISSTTLGWSPHNLRLQSQSGTGWTAGDVSGVKTANALSAPDGTVTANSWTADSGNDQHYIFSPNATVVASVSYTLSVYLKYLNHQFVSVYTAALPNQWFEVTVDLVNGTVTQTTDGTSATSSESSITSVGNGWYRVSVTGTVTGTLMNHQIGINSTGTPTLDTNGDETITASGDGFYWWGAQLTRGNSPTAYIATTSAAVIGLPISYGEGLLVEPAATNLVTRSQEIDDAAWTKNTATVATNSTTAPDGSTTADTLTADAGSGLHTAYRTCTTTSSATHTLSAYVKDSTARYIIAVFSSDATSANWCNAVYDLQTVTVTDTDAGAGGTNTSSSITSVGSGWYRITLTGAIGAVTDGDAIFRLSDTGTPAVFTGFGSYTWTAAGTEAMFVWGAQLELGTIATSYIPTTSASVTRAKDVVEGTVSTVSATENSIYWDGIHKELQTSSFGEMYIFGTDAIGWQQWQALTSTAYRFEVDNTTTQVNMTVNGGSAAGVRTQTSVALKANDFAFSANGAAVGANTDVSGTMPSTGTTALDLGHDAGVAGMNGFIRRFIQVPRRVIDADLPTWRYNF